MSRKDNRLNDTISLIRQAIRACGDDFATLGVRGKLMAALHECNQVQKKRTRRELGNKQAMLEAIQKAQQKADEWWKRIEENVRKATKEAPKDQADDSFEQT